MTVKYAWGTSSEIALSWLSLFLTYDNPTLVPVMLTQFYGATCHRAFILWHQAFILINAEILLKGTLGNTLHWNFNRNTCIFCQQNAFQTVICENATI